MHKRCECCSWGRFLLGAFLWFMDFVGVPDRKLQWWAWEMTPIPMGFPSWRQYLKGVRFFWKTRNS